MTWLAIAAGVMLALLLSMLLLGLLLPQGRVVARSARFDPPPEAVWSVVADYAGQIAWRPDLKAIEPLSDRNGHPVWREVRRAGPPLTLETVVCDPPRRLVRRLVDPELAFGGSWIFDLEPTDDGCILTLTEKAEVYNPVLRLLARLFWHDAAAVETYLGALGRRFGVDVEIREVG